MFRFCGAELDTAGQQVLCDLAECCSRRWRRETRIGYAVERAARMIWAGCFSGMKVSSVRVEFAVGGSMRLEPRSAKDHCQCEHEY